MPVPNFQFFHAGSTQTAGTEIASASPILFGTVHAGRTSQTISIDIWNDRVSANSSDTASSPVLVVEELPDDIGEVIDGTESNGEKAMIEARSCGSFNCIADQNTAWSKVTKTSGLQMGDMPRSSRRTIELRIVCPEDAVSMTAKRFRFRVLF